MEPPKNPTLLSAEDFLAGEPLSEVRHEFIGGVVYAMAGATKGHNTLAGNLFAALHAHLRGGPCRAYIADMKVRLEIANDDIFYYPDIVVEILSPETERTDRREKFLSYTQLETLEEYVLVAQSKTEVTVFRRKNRWQPELFQLPAQELYLESVELKVAVAEVYEGVR